MKERVARKLKKLVLNLLFVCIFGAILFSTGVQAYAQNVAISETNNHVMGNN